MTHNEIIKKLTDSWQLAMLTSIAWLIAFCFKTELPELGMVSLFNITIGIGYLNLKSMVEFKHPISKGQVILIAAILELFYVFIPIATIFRLIK